MWTLRSDSDDIWYFSDSYSEFSVQVQWSQNTSQQFTEELCDPTHQSLQMKDMSLVIITINKVTPYNTHFIL